MENPRRMIEPRPLTSPEILETRIGARGLTAEHGKAQLRFVREDLAEATGNSTTIKRHLEDGVSLGVSLGATRADLESVLAMKRLGFSAEAINNFLDAKEKIERAREDDGGSTLP